MQFSIVAAALFAGAAMAQTTYTTVEVTVTSCAATVTDCPARSTVTSTTSYPVITSTPIAVNTTSYPPVTKTYTPPVYVNTTVPGPTYVPPPSVVTVTVQGCPAPVPTSPSGPVNNATTTASPPAYTGAASSVTGSFAVAGAAAIAAIFFA